MDELRIALDSVRDKLKDLFSRVNQLEAAPTITSGSGGGAPVDAQYLVLAFNAILTNERRLDFSARFATVDGGAGGDYDVDLAASGVAAAVYGSATQSPQITVDIYGRITNAANVAITGVPPLAHPLLGNTYHNDVVNQGPTRGSLVYGNATPLWDELVLGGISGSVLTRNATDVLWSAGALSFSGAFTLTIPATGTAVLGTGAANRVTYWTGTNTASSDAGLTVDAANNAYLVADAGGIGNTFATAFLGFDSSGAQDYAYFSSCYVGINDTTPSYHLDVNGKIGINGTQTIYSAQALGTFTGTMYFGNGGGSLVHAGGDDAYYNTAGGHNALFSNTSGSGNTAFGYFASWANTIGANNSAFGAQALQTETSGGYTCAFGAQALYTQNGAAGNVAVGALSGYFVTTGNYNVFIGYSAGRFTAVGNNSTPSYSVFIGYDSQPAANGETNEVVIGGNTPIGNGSNTTTIGVAATTDAYIFGNHVLENQHFIGVTGDVRTTYDATNGYIIEQLDDAAGADEWRVYDSTPTAVATIDSDGNGYFAATLGVGTAPTGVFEASGTSPSYFTRSGAGVATQVIIRNNNVATNGDGTRIAFQSGGTNQGAIVTQYVGGSTAAFANMFLQSGGLTTTMTLDASQNVGIGITTPGAKLHVDQPSTTGAIPVLTLDQADLSEEFINFTSTVGAGNPIDTAALGAYYGKIRVQVQGVGYKYMALYDS